MQREDNRVVAASKRSLGRSRGLAGWKGTGGTKHLSQGDDYQVHNSDERRLVMIEPFLSENHQKEALSYAYLLAIASECGYSCQPGPQPDADSIDATLRAKGGMRAQIDVQLKATAVPTVRDGILRYRLKKKNYNDLCIRRSTPLVLVIFELPQAREDWLSWSPEEIALRRRAWWLVLEGATPIESETKTVSVPDTQLLSPDELRGMMARAARGELP